MAVVDVHNSEGAKIDQIDLPDTIFTVPVKKSLLHDIVRMQLSGRRAGTAAVKHRSDVSGSRHKLFRQKGTGRARRGDIKSPLLRGGGSIFGPDPRSHAYTIPKKARRLGLKMALSSKLADNTLIVLDKLELEQIKTRAFVAVIDNLEVGNALIVTDAKNENLERSSRNVRAVKVLRTEGLNVYDILKYETLILLKSSIPQIEERLRK